MRVLFLVAALALALSGCAATAVVGAAASVVGAAASVTGSVVSGTVDVVGSGVSGAIDIATSDDDDDEVADTDTPKKSEPVTQEEIDAEESNVD